MRPTRTPSSTPACSASDRRRLPGGPRFFKEATMSPVRTILLLPILLATAPALPAAQTPAGAPVAEQKFEETSQVVAVEVPVNVLGRDGKPVRGLTAADFEVYDAGQRQAVTGFEVIDLKT